tara:strand:- start:6825 stop:8624 length:1800 start_codon:yes stop_codon:yes gene_type:complete
MLVNQNDSAIRVGGGSGYWGDSDMALPQLLQSDRMDYVVFDYLAEITMSIMARARKKSPDAGYAPDFVTNVVGPNLEIVAKKGVKILSNAGGVNPRVCASEIEKLIEVAGLDLKVATVYGDDLTARADEFSDAREMFSGDAFPDPETIASINAYLGAFPIADALNRGADIVITGRCVDSALTLAACIHAFGWRSTDWDLLSAGSLAGHLLECGPQASGGNFTDWDRVAETLHAAGYPIAEIQANGEFIVTKPSDTGGEVSVGTVAEQMLYEIGDPRAYTLPDVDCDFSDVTIQEVGADRVSVRGANGRAASNTYKASATFADGWKISTLWYFIGERALEKSNHFATAALARSRRKLGALGFGDFREVSVEPFGSEAHFGAWAREEAGREVAIKIAAKHDNPKALQILLKEASGLALAAPPGLALYAGGRPKPSPVVRLFSFLVDKDAVDAGVRIGTECIPHSADMPNDIPAPLPPAPNPIPPRDRTGLVSVPLRRLAWGRSGDKGDKANIGIVPRHKEYAPWIWEQLTEQAVSERFAHFLEGPVERFFLPGTAAINFLLHDVLGGGGIASLRNDPQGKSYAQVLLEVPIELPRSVLMER